MARGPARVFISHVHEDADFAEAIAAWIEPNLLQGVKCFNSSSRGIPLGSQWLNEVSAALAGSAVMLVLVSHASLSRRWIYFEAGAGFVRGIPVVPVCIGGMTKLELEPPLNFLQAIELPNLESERRLLALVAEPADLEPPPMAPRIVLPTRVTQSSASIDEKIRPRRIFANTADNAFTDFFDPLAKNARHIVVAGTGLNILYRAGIIELLGPDANNQWEIYVANPYSPEVESRLVEEEAGSPRPPVGKAGLVQRLETLLDFERRRADRSLVVKLFSRYPTISFFIIDGLHYFFYPYGFSTLGDFSPVLYCSADDPKDFALVTFLKGQHEKTQECAVDAEFVYRLQPGRRYDQDVRRAAKQKLVAFSVYIIPEEDTPLYDFGSACLGFDVRAQRTVESRWAPKHIRQAAEFGLHVTVADALYVADEWSLKILESELRVLAKEFRPFPLRVALEAGFPDPASISLLCHDETGSLEALHHEMVFRCYRQAIASNYSDLFGHDRARMNRTYGEGPQRAELMIERYHAPYIMNAYKPHLSLLSNVDEADMPGFKRELEQNLPKSSFTVRSICLMTKPKDSSQWRILDESRFK